MNKQSWLSRNWRDVLKTVLLLAVVFFAVMGHHFSDAAGTSFWANTWTVIAIVCLVVWVAGWVFLWSKKPRR
jgi:protein-S-isoprenylcysteine O-methyltransferase Ste14